MFSFYSGYLAHQAPALLSVSPWYGPPIPDEAKTYFLMFRERFININIRV